ncbi:MAG: hypothetical protein ACYDHX_02350 [Methanothrix sp.]
MILSTAKGICINCIRYGGQEMQRINLRIEGEIPVYRITDKEDEALGI